MADPGAVLDSPSAIAESYIQFCENEAQNYDEELDMSAWEKVDGIVRSDPALAWKVILEIIERRRSDDILDRVAVGPMEDLMCYHGEKVIELVELEAEKSAPFRRVIAGVWLSRSDTSVCERFCRIAGTEPLDDD